MKPEYEGMLRAVTQWSLWTYKDKTYQVMTVTPGMLSQDAELDEWSPTVIYSSYGGELHETHVVGSLTLRFARPITEFTRKFKRFEQEEKK